MSETYLTIFLFIVSITSIFLELRKNRKRKLLRVAFLILISVSFYLILVPLQLTKSKKAINIVFQNGEVSKLPDSINRKKYHIINDLSELDQIEKKWNIENFAVIGNGLNEDQLKLIQRDFDYYPSNLQQGVKKLEIPVFFTGNDDAIRVELINSDNLRLILSNQSETHIGSLTGNKSYEFNLNFDNPGYYDMVLTGVKEKDTILSEPIPVEVRSSPELSVIVWTSAPSFELKEIVRYLKDLGAGIAIRHQLSPELDFTEKVNLDRFDFGNLGNNSLKNFDLLIIDDEAFQKLTSKEKRVTKTMVKNGELGLLFVNVKNKLEVENFQISSSNTETEKLRLQGNERAYSLNRSQYAIEEKGNPVMGGDESVIEYVPFGMGKIGISTVTNSYILNIGGDSDLYGSLWSSALKTLSANRTAEGKIPNASLAFLNRRTEVVHRVSNSQEIDDFLDKQPMVENMILPNYYHSVFWPKTTGWLDSDYGSTIFVLDTADWKSLMEINKRVNTELASQQENAILPVVNNEEIPKYLPYILLVVFCGALWLEEKL